MAYCVKCGVKLQDGVKVCPLCATNVALPDKMVEIPEKPLYPKDTKAESEKGLDKTRKALLEITLIILLVSEVVIGVSIRPVSDALIPMLCVLYAAVVFLIPVLIEHPSYFSIGSMEMAATGFLLLLLELLISGGCSWSLVVLLSLALVWVLSELPFLLRKHLGWMFLIQALSVAAFILLLDAMYPPITWALGIGLPTFGFMIALALIFLGRFKAKWFTKASSVDLVLSILAIICLTTAFADLAFQEFKGIRWSRPLWISGTMIFVFELLISVARRIKNYFNTRNN